MKETLRHFLHACLMQETGDNFYCQAYAWPMLHFRRFTVFAERHVRLFRNGRNQAVRIPREFELDAREVIMRREVGRLVIEPVQRTGLLATLAQLSPIEDDFPDVDASLLAPDAIDL